MPSASMNPHRDTHSSVSVILTARDLSLFRVLVTARILASDQVQTICGFGTVRRTNARLLGLVRAGYLRRWFVATKAGGHRGLYGLSPKGALAIGEQAARLLTWKQGQLLTGNQFVAHQLAINEISLEVQFRPLPPAVACRRWLNFLQPISKAVPLIPDAYFEIAREGIVIPMFLELDRGTEPLNVWRKKVERYVDLAITGESERVFQQKRFRVLIVAESSRRLAFIRSTVARQTDKLFWFGTLSEINKDGLWNSLWSRPTEATPVTLL